MDSNHNSYSPGTAATWAKPSSPRGQVRASPQITPRGVSPRLSVHSQPLDASRIMSPRPSQAGTRHPSVARHANASLQATWTELLEHLDQTRPAQGGSADGSTDRVELLDVGRVRRLGQMLMSVINQLPDDLLRNILAALTEELFSATFRDYSFSYDPRQAKKSEVERQTSGPARKSEVERQTSRPPMRLSEESLAQAVPYAAVVASLREAAKDAIIRRLELEAKIGGSGPEMMPGDFEADQGSARQARAGEEVRLREELRHARLLADTYQARSLELERSRVELLEEVRRVRLDKEKNDGRRHKLLDEVRRLRSEAESARSTKQQEKAATVPEAVIRTSPTPSKRTAIPSGNSCRATGARRGTSASRATSPDEESSGYNAPSEEQLPSSRLGPFGGLAAASSSSSTETSAPLTSGTGFSRSPAQSSRASAATSTCGSSISVIDGVGSIMAVPRKVRRGSDGALGFVTAREALSTSSRGQVKIRTPQSLIAKGMVVR